MDRGRSWCRRHAHARHTDPRCGKLWLRGQPGSSRWRGAWSDGSATVLAVTYSASHRPRLAGTSGSDKPPGRCRHAGLVRLQSAKSLAL